MLALSLLHPPSPLDPTDTTGDRASFPCLGAYPATKPRKQPDELRMARRRQSIQRARELDLHARIPSPAFSRVTVGGIAFVFSPNNRRARERSRRRPPKPYGARSVASSPFQQTKLSTRRTCIPACAEVLPRSSHHRRLAELLRQSGLQCILPRCSVRPH